MTIMHALVLLSSIVLLVSTVFAAPRQYVTSVITLAPPEPTIPPMVPKTAGVGSHHVVLYKDPLLTHSRCTFAATTTSMAHVFITSPSPALLPTLAYISMAPQPVSDPILVLSAGFLRMSPLRQTFSLSMLI